MIVVVLTITLIFFAIALIVAISRPHFIFYALAAVISVVGIHIHLGATFYLSRMVIMLFVLSLIVVLLRGGRIRFPAQFLSSYFLIFFLILLFQFVSVMFSSQVQDGLRQILIYMSVMTIFVVIIMVATSVEIVLTGIKIYLWIGLIQGLYGIYQVVGGPFKWPTYQTLLAAANIPTSNDHTIGGYLYSGAYQTFRALGFFPADMSHYAGYMAGVLLLALACLTYNRRMILPYFVVLFGGAGLILSLSRSGMLAFLIFGLPTLLFLLSKIYPAKIRKSRRSFVPTLLGGGLALALIGPPLLSVFDIKLPNATEIISSRLADLLSPGANQNESMGEHVATKLAGLDALMTSPLLGVGLGVNASPWYSEKYERGWGGSHSHHLDILGQTGLIGAGLQFLFMALIARYMWRGLFVSGEVSLERHILAGLLAAYMAIIFGNFMYHYFTLDFVWFLMGSGIALSRLLILKAEKNAAAASG